MCAVRGWWGGDAVWHLGYTRRWMLTTAASVRCNEAFSYQSHIGCVRTPVGAIQNTVPSYKTDPLMPLHMARCLCAPIVADGETGSANISADLGDSLPSTHPTELRQPDPFCKGTTGKVPEIDNW